MTERLKSGREILRHLGPGWVAYRLWHSVDQRSGRIRKRLKAGTWNEVRLQAKLRNQFSADDSEYYQYRSEKAPTFFFKASEFPTWASWFAEFDPDASFSVLNRADEIECGRFPVFSHGQVNAGFPPNWLCNIQNGEVLRGDVHFSRIGDFQSGDIKGVWELSRFSFVFALVRAFARRQDERYAETFWQLFEAWLDQNPPNTGANWKCGQETAFRIMAWIFGLYSFMNCAATTSKRVLLMATALSVSGERIAGHIHYALSQKNNHGVSEAVGLFTLGLLFPEFNQAHAWKRSGARYLEQLGRTLIYDDGAFAQNSFNYERVALHDFIWALRLADIHGQPFSEELKKRVFKSAAFLYEMQDEISGKLPNYGHNDGAQVLQLTNCDYRDFRPVLQTAYFFETGKLDYGPPNEAWNEELLWLFGTAALRADRAKRPRHNLKPTLSGYAVIRGPRSFGFIRFPKFRHRPGQSDLLHFDLWFGGENIVGDPGTYSYNAAPPWDNSLEKTLYHNTVSIGGRDQMRKASKFLWLPWPKSEVRCLNSTESLSYIEGEHFGYAPARHRRAVMYFQEEIWIVCDAVNDCAEETVRLHWLFPNTDATWDPDCRRLDLPLKSGMYHYHFGVLGASPSVSLVSADKNSARGWISHYYLEKDPAMSFAATVPGPNVLFFSVFAPIPLKMDISENMLSLRTGATVLELTLGRDGKAPLVRNVFRKGEGLVEQLITNN